MSFHLRRIFTSLAVLVALVPVGAAQAQDGVIAGTVTDGA